MKTLSKFALSLTAALACALPSVCVASVFSAKIRKLHFSPKRNYSRGLDASKIQPVTSLRDMTSEDVAKMIPTDLSSTSDTRVVTSRILALSVQNVINSDAVKHSTLGSTAQSVQQTMQDGMTVASREPNSVQHELKFSMKPTQTEAMVRYSGLTNARVSYLASESKMDVEIREPFEALATDVVFNHVNIPGDRKDVMSLSWSW